MVSYQKRERGRRKELAVFPKPKGVQYYGWLASAFNKYFIRQRKRKTVLYTHTQVVHLVFKTRFLIQ